MPSLAHHVAEAIDRGVPVPKETFDAIPRTQLRVWFSEVVSACPSRRAMGVERRPANALNIEIGQPLPRCMEQSPDGRGLAWILSGGSALAYGTCCASACPRLKERSR